MATAQTQYMPAAQGLGPNTFPVEPLLPASEVTVLGGEAQVLVDQPIVNEHLLPQETVFVQPIIDRQRVIEEIQPVFQRSHEVLQTQQEIQVQLPSERRELLPETPAVVPMWRPTSGIRDTRPVQREYVVQNPVVRETLIRKVVEEIQPVIDRDLIQTTVVRQLQPIYEQVYENRIYHEPRYVTAPPQTAMAAGLPSAVGAASFQQGGGSGDYGPASWMQPQTLGGGFQGGPWSQAMPEQQGQWSTQAQPTGSYAYGNQFAGSQSWGGGAGAYGGTSAGFQGQGLSAQPTMFQGGSQPYGQGLGSSFSQQAGLNQPGFQGQGLQGQGLQRQGLMSEMQQSYGQIGGLGGGMQPAGLYGQGQGSAFAQGYGQSQSPGMRSQGAGYGRSLPGQQSGLMGEQGSGLGVGQQQTSGPSLTDLKQAARHDIAQGEWRESGRM